jgi:hypothetical protein
LLVVPALLAARGRKAQSPALLVVSVVGFSGMASAVLILAVTQSAMGALHHLLGALLSANMAGLAMAATKTPRSGIGLWGALGVGLVVPALLPLLSRVSTQVPAPVMMGALRWIASSARRGCWNWAWITCAPACWTGPRACSRN